MSDSQDQDAALRDAALQADVRAANLGDRRALERVVASIQDPVYRLALRMLGRPAEAEDAAQEILIRVVTGLSSYRGDAAFRTWVHRVGVNHLLNVRKQGPGKRQMTFDDFGAALDAGVAAALPSDHPDPLVTLEARLVCSQAMLQCLDDEQRVAYLLGEVLELPSAEASEILQIADATYRKRLERARSQMEAFTSKQCGIVNPDAACRCKRQVGPLLAHGMIDPQRLVLARHPAIQGSTIEGTTIESTLQTIDTIKSAAQLMRAHPEYKAPDSFVRGLRSVLARA